MVISDYASKLSLPHTNPGVATVLEYLVIKFPYIDAQTWRQRMADGKVHCHDGTPIAPDTPYTPQQRIYYYREGENEPRIPFEESILFQDSHILVAYKPHFLALHASGVYINECLQNRLRRRTGIDTLQAVHRLDSVTAGLVLFSVNPDTRRHYHQLFDTRQIHKTYQAIASVEADEKLIGQEWEIKNRIERTKLRFRMGVTEGEANSHSIIRCLQQTNQKALFELHPITGKTHQLRLHMQSLGWPILNDMYYPQIRNHPVDDYSAPLQLLAKELAFVDPVSGSKRQFSCERSLKL
ncbi:MAG: pseudouridine synthase [Gammaproteobacteria bacterium]